MKRYHGLFDNIVSFCNLLSATDKAAMGKRDKPAPANFLFYPPAVIRISSNATSAPA